MEQQAGILRPEHVAPIRSLSLRARLIVEGLIAGMHRSPFHGFSAEFSEFRPYRTGESTRMIDWRKYARTERTVVRLFEDETNLYARILLDKSASMGFAGSGEMSKFDYARTLAASLAWILVRQRDAVGLAAFDNRVDVSIPPRSTNVQLKTILGHLDMIEPGSETRCGAAVNTIAHTLRKRGLCILISDLLDDPEEIIRGLHHLHFRQQDVMVVRVLDPEEHQFRPDGFLRVRDVETGEMVSLDAETAGEYYRTGFAAHSEQIEAGCRSRGVDYEVIRTDEPFARAILRILERRRRLH
jgi:uncharacterized protein (DUF58 family)